MLKITSGPKKLRFATDVIVCWQQMIKGTTATTNIAFLLVCIYDRQIQENRSNEHAE